VLEIKLRGVIRFACSLAEYMAPELVRCPTQPGLLRYAGASSSDTGSLQSAGSAGSTASSSSLTPQQQQQQQAMRRYDARKVDAWALGVLLYVLVCAQYPFSVSGSHWRAIW
jgi:hypothetical protein